MKTPSYLKLTVLCHMLAIDYNKAYFGRLESNEKAVLSALINAVESTVNEFLEYEK
jgi:hypothetical protein